MSNIAAAGVAAGSAQKIIASAVGKIVILLDIVPASNLVSAGGEAAQQAPREWPNGESDPEFHTTCLNAIGGSSLLSIRESKS
jgi:hypothetical protein